MNYINFCCRPVYKANGRQGQGPGHGRDKMEMNSVSNQQLQQNGQLANTEGSNNIIRSQSFRREDISNPRFESTTNTMVRNARQRPASLSINTKLSSLNESDDVLQPLREAPAPPGKPATENQLSRDGNKRNKPVRPPLPNITAVKNKETNMLGTKPNESNAVILSVITEGQNGDRRPIRRHQSDVTIRPSSSLSGAKNAKIDTAIASDNAASAMNSSIAASRSAVSKPPVAINKPTLAVSKPAIKGSSPSLKPSAARNGPGNNRCSPTPHSTARYENIPEGGCQIKSSPLQKQIMGNAQNCTTQSATDDTSYLEPVACCNTAKSVANRKKMFEQGESSPSIGGANKTSL